MTDQLMDDLTNEEHEALLLMSEHAIAPPLSPAAKAVLDELDEQFNELNSQHMAAAVTALRAAADQMAAWVDEDGRIDLGDLLAIAAELEAL